MSIYPTISFEEYLAAIDALAARKPKKAKSSEAWLQIAASVVLAVFTYFVIREPGPRGSVFGLLAFLVIYLLYAQLFARKNVVRFYRTIYDQELPSLSGQQLTIDETGIATKWAHGQSHCRWDGFIDCINQPTDFLFLPSPNSFIRVPKKDLSAEQQQNILTWSSTLFKGKVQ